MMSAYSDRDAAALYDVLNPWAASDDFHLRHMMAAPSVLDVGCGTGTLLARARDNGHTGRLCGVDPDEGMLGQARAKSIVDVEWVLAGAADLTFRAEFAHALMASHAFQCLATDDDLRASLAAIRAALVDGGTFAFETRNRLAREWETWTPDNAWDVIDHEGRELRMVYDVRERADGVVTVAETTADRDGATLRVDHADLRFITEADLDAYLADAGFTVAERYGDFAGGPCTPSSGVIVTVARAGR
jgi:SAM-dependent methyltransferase